MKLYPRQSVIIIKLPKLKSACSLEIQYTHAKPSVSNCDKFFSAFDNLCELCLIGTSFPNCVSSCHSEYDIDFEIHASVVAYICFIN